jgi:hypothetical protein
MQCIRPTVALVAGPLFYVSAQAYTRFQSRFTDDKQTRLESCVPYYSLRWIVTVLMTTGTIGFSLDVGTCEILSATSWPDTTWPKIG